ncbi:DUF3841 domain-containing protein [Arthrobacter sp. NA-172]|uniref:DUF3841 domain-containing protein n=1 Tax=Arthrobacter sp. NA-172 TaxID=3367524 RepID=UPI003754B9DB
MKFPIRTARRDRAVPPGRIPNDIGSSVLLLHTLQAEEAFEELLSTGRIVPDPSRADPDFEDAYAWMFRQMEQRLPTRGEGALWLWAKIRRRDLVSNWCWPDGNILLTRRVPRERVLLSMYGHWHRVLNASPNVLPLPGESDDAYGDRLDVELDDFFDQVQAAGVRYDAVSTWPDYLRNEIEASWESIFDPAVSERTSYWQATVHELRVEDVVEAVRLQN